MSIGLDQRPADVVAMEPKAVDYPHVVVGAASNTPFGPCVCFGAGAPVGDTTWALIAHVPPAFARDIAERLLAAADEVEAMPIGSVQ